MANSHYVAYLDDYDWRAADHLASMMQAISWKHWAVADRWMVRQETLWPIRRDKWDSVSPGSGINNERYAGFVAPSGLTLDKRACGTSCHSGITLYLKMAAATIAASWLLSTAVSCGRRPDGTKSITC